MAKKLRNEPRVFSYQRFSSPEQARGDSFRRQSVTSFERAQAIAKERRMPFDESLSAGDPGLSAFTGAHRDKGVLGTFLAAIKRGDIPSGSILVVENIDRISRLAAIDAIKMIIIGIIGEGISIITDTAEYDQNSLDEGLIYQLIGEIKRAHGESKKKSERLKAMWAEKRKHAEAGQLITKMVPGWLGIKLPDGRILVDRNSDEWKQAKVFTFVAIPEAAKAIRSVFAMKIKGLGIPAIEKKLNLSGAWSIPAYRKRSSGGWRDTYISKLLRDRALLGEYQMKHLENGKRVPTGDAIPGYFPQVIKPEVFHTVQEMIKDNKSTGGRNGKTRNLFRSLVKCAYCGVSMHFIDKGRNRGNGAYLVCWNGRRRFICDWIAFRYEEVEELLLDNCPKLKPEMVLPNPDEQASRVEELTTRVEGQSARLKDLDRKIGNLVDQLQDTSSKALRARYEGRIVELEREKDEIAEKLKGTEAELKTADFDAKSFREWKKGLVELKETLATGEGDVRDFARNHFRQFISRIDYYTRGHDKTWDSTAREGEDLAEYIEACVGRMRTPKAQREDFAEFLTDVTQRRMSREGRFIRVTFKTGAVVNLVPPKSIASGMKLVDGKRWESVVPDLQELYDAFKARKKQGKVSV